MSSINRRDFLRTSFAAAGAMSLPTIIPSSALGLGHRPAPSDRVTLAFIGTGNMGTNHVHGFLEDERVQIVAVCDVNEMSGGYWNGGVAGREPAQSYVNFHYGDEISSGKFSGCDVYEDFRDVLAREDIDAVVVSTPDHWHGIQVVRAAQAGKDIYGEKPLSLTVRQGRAMSDAVAANDVIFQTGSQQRSDERFRHASELVLNGRIGELKKVTCGLPPGHPDFGMTAHRTAPEPIPAGFDYDFWLGPAPEAPYSPARCHVNFRWILDYSGGQVTDWGGHHPDIAQWAMGKARTGPSAIRNAKGTFPTDGLYNTATDFYFEAHYDDGTVMVVTSSEPNGIRFEGTEGWIFVSRSEHQVSDPNIWSSVIGEGETRLPYSDNHRRNFIDGVITRVAPVAPVEEAHRSITVAHLGNIAMMLQRDLRWDPSTERFIGDDEASAMLDRPMRAPWTL